MSSKVTRVVLVDHRKDIGKGRIYDCRDDEMTIELSYQDDGRTLKVFLRSQAQWLCEGRA
jgi:hypothetical protein